MSKLRISNVEGLQLYVSIDIQCQLLYIQINQNHKTGKAIILSLKLREERRMKLFENRVFEENI